MVGILYTNGTVFYCLMNVVADVWWVIANPDAPDERITMQSGAEKYALVFLDAALARHFLQGLHDAVLVLERLEGWVLKDTYLLTLQMLGVTRVVFDYQQGKHNALSAPLGAVQTQVRQSNTSSAPKVQN
jgi:hypothetical protein